MELNGKSREELITEIQRLETDLNVLRISHEEEMALLTQMREKLKSSEEQMREVLENSLDASYKRNLKTGSYEYFSPVIAAITGYTPVEMNTLPLEKTIQMMHPDDIANIEKQVSEAINKGVGSVNLLEYRFRHKSGQYRWLFDRFTVIQDDTGQPAALIGSVSDITELKKTTDALRESEALYRAVLNASPDDITITDMTGKVIMVSDAAVKMFGLASKEDAIGCALYDFIDPAQRDRAFTNMNNFLQGKQSVLREYVGLRRDGSTLDVEVHGDFVRDEAGNAIYLIFVVRDITLRKRVEQELIKAKEMAEESNRLKSSFLANLSHEIRTPMNGILGFSELLMDPGISREEFEKYLQIIRKSSNSLLNIINDIVDIAKIESGTMELHNSKININEKIDYLYPPH